MRPALERLRHIERHLLGQPSAAERAGWQLQLLTDPDLAADAEAQRHLYHALQQVGRQQLRQELEVIHGRLHRAARRRWLQTAADQLWHLLRRR